jgi:hypothetical protein
LTKFWVEVKVAVLTKIVQGHMSKSLSPHSNGARLSEIRRSSHTPHQLQPNGCEQINITGKLCESGKRAHQLLARDYKIKLSHSLGARCHRCGCLLDFPRKDPRAALLSKQMRDRALKYQHALLWRL